MKKNNLDIDDYFIEEVKRIITKEQKVSTALLQRRLSIGYFQASNIITELEKRGIVGPADGAKPRKILIENNEIMSDEYYAKIGYLFDRNKEHNKDFVEIHRNYKYVINDYINEKLKNKIDISEVENILSGFEEMLNTLNTCTFDKDRNTYKVGFMGLMYLLRDKLNNIKNENNRSIKD